MVKKTIMKLAEEVDKDEEDSPSSGKGTLWRTNLLQIAHLESYRIRPCTEHFYCFIPLVLGSIKLILLAARLTLICLQSAFSTKHTQTHIYSHHLLNIVILGIPRVLL